MFIYKLYFLYSDQSYMISLDELLVSNVNDLAYRLDVSNSTVGWAFSNWIEDLFVNLKCLIKSPSQEMVRQSSPSIFKDLYPDTQCIIHYTEIFIEHPYRYAARAQTLQKTVITKSIILLSF